MKQKPIHNNSVHGTEKTFVLKVLIFIGVLFCCSILGTVLLLVCGMLGGLEFSSTIDIFSLVEDPALKPYIKTGIGLNHFSMFSVSALLFAYILKKDAWKAYFDTYIISFDLMFKFLLLLLFAYPLIGASSVVLQSIDLPEWMDTMDEESIDSLMKMLQMDGPFDLLVNLIIIAILPAIGEELLFRGVMQKELLKILSNHHVAIIISSIIFSAVHLQIQGFLPKLIIGLIVGYAYYWTKSIWVPMLLHFFNNAMPTVALYLGGDNLEAMQSETESPETLQLIIGVGISCFLCYLLVQNIFKQINNQKSIQV